MPVAPVVTTPFSREKLLQIARTLPADLQVLSQLGEMLQDANSDLEEVAALLRRDVALAARIVRISNSPVYGGGGQIASTEEAVNRVGFSEILKLVGTATAARITDRALDFYGIRAEAIRDNMLYGALAAEAIAKATGQDSRVAYTGGLMRPLGIMVLDRACRGQPKAVSAYSPETAPSYAAWENSVFGVNSREVTANVLEEWRFPHELIASIRSHYLTHVTDWDRPLAVLLNVAGGLSRSTGRSLPGEDAAWEITQEKRRALGLGDEDIEPILASAEIAFDVATAALAV